MSAIWSYSNQCNSHQSNINASDKLLLSAAGQQHHDANGTAPSCPVLLESHAAAHPSAKLVERKKAELQQSVLVVVVVSLVHQVFSIKITSCSIACVAVLLTEYPAGSSHGN
jgi:hypothetical protein